MRTGVSVVISVNSLPVLLETIGIDDDDVSIGEDADNRWCVLQRSDGTWSVSTASAAANSTNLSSLSSPTHLVGSHDPAPDHQRTLPVRG
jgi:hypothetical protein